jgi:hypothetical protein
LHTGMLRHVHRSSESVVSVVRMVHFSPLPSVCTWTADLGSQFSVAHGVARHVRRSYESAVSVVRMVRFLITERRAHRQGHQACSHVALSCTYTSPYSCESMWQSILSRAQHSACEVRENMQLLVLQEWGRWDWGLVVL